MNFFSKVKNLPKDSGIELMILLRYGEIRPGVEFVSRLPEGVVHAAFDKILPDRLLSNFNTLEFKRTTLENLIVGPLASRAILEALILYHSLVQNM